MGFFDGLLDNVSKFVASVSEQVGEDTSSDSPVIVDPNKVLPSGRGFYVWRLEKFVGGDVGKIIERCHDCGVTWLAIKCGNVGSPWKQFNPELVKTLKDAGIAVGGWSYDVPSVVDKQVEVVKMVCDAGADFYMTDSEVEWEHISNADKVAADYINKMRSVTASRPEFVLGSAPWDAPAGHPRYPFFGLSGVDFQSCQAYWPEHGLSPEKTMQRCLKQWSDLDKKHPTAKRPHLEGGYSIKTNADQMRRFEKLCADASQAGVLYWEASQTRNDIWNALKGTSFNNWNGE